MRKENTFFGKFAPGIANHMETQNFLWSWTFPTTAHKFVLRVQHLSVCPKLKLLCVCRPGCVLPDRVGEACLMQCANNLSCHNTDKVCVRKYTMCVGTGVESTQRLWFCFDAVAPVVCTFSDLFRFLFLMLAECAPNCDFCGASGDRSCDRGWCSDGYYFDETANTTDTVCKGECSAPFS